MGGTLPLHQRLWVCCITNPIVQLALCGLHLVGSVIAWGCNIAPPRRFILLAAPRTGSTLLLGLLREHHAVLAMGEVSPICLHVRHAFTILNLLCRF